MKTLVELKKMSFIPHHDCACCGEIIGWYPQEPNPFFDPSCGCGSGGGHYETWETVFKWYNSAFEKESDDAVQNAWKREIENKEIKYVRTDLDEFRQDVSILLNRLNYRIDNCVEKDHVDSIVHILSRIDNELQLLRYNKAVLEILENHKSNWKPNSKGGEPNHR